MNEVSQCKFPTRRLRYLFDVKSGGTPSSNVDEYWDGDIHWITPEDLGNLEGRVILDTRRKLTDWGYENSGATMAPSGSIVLSKRAPIGLIAITGIDSSCNQGCFLLTKKTNIDERFYYYALVHQRLYLENLGSGSTFTELSIDDLLSIKLPFPDLAVQKSIADFLEQQTEIRNNLIHEMNQTIKLIHENRNALISAVISGQQQWNA